MLLASRLAGLSGLEAHYAGIGASRQSDARGSSRSVLANSLMFAVKDLDAAQRSVRRDSRRREQGGAELGAERETTVDQALIPRLTGQNRWVHSRIPMDMMRQGWSMSLFQASQQRSTICS